MRYYSINRQSFDQLPKLKEKILKTDKLAEIKVEFFRPFCIAYLDQLFQQINRTTIVRTLRSTYPNANQYLKQVGFSYLDNNCRFFTPFPQNEIITIKRFKGSQNVVENDVVEWIKSDIVPFLPNLDRTLQKKIVENIWEIVNNGLLHGQSEMGISSCGQFYPQKGYFEVAFCDFGYGIPFLTREYLKSSSPTSDSECISWAVKKGNSTKPFSISAGMGLHLLREFLKVNKGTFQIVSGVGYFSDDPPTSLADLKNRIDGTLVNLRVIFDSKTYSLVKREQ